MDIEGFEHKVLYNNLEKLPKLEALLIEIHSTPDLEFHGWNINEYIEKNDSLKKMIKYLIQNNFKTILDVRGTKITEKTSWNDIKSGVYTINNEKKYYKVINIVAKR